VNFLVDGQQTASAALVNGVSSVSLTLAAGAHTVSAVYPATGNFAGSNGSVAVTVSDVALTVIYGAGQSAIYGSFFAQPLTVALKNAAGEPLAGQTVTFVTNGVALSSYSQVTNVSGEVSVVATAAEAGNLSVFALVGGALGAKFSLTGVQAPLTVSAGNLIVLQEHPIPKPSYTITGLANGDSPTVLTGAPVITTAATNASPAGIYPITVAAGKLANPNYERVCVPGSLTIAAPTAAASIAISSGNGQSAAQGTALGAPLTVLVKNSSGQPVSGTVVTFICNGATTFQNTVLTNASGLASVVAIPTRTGAVSVVAEVTGTGLSATFQETGN
jgi:hypothetical protein